MRHSGRLSRTSAVFSVAILAVISAAASATAQQHHPQVPKSLRLYVFDCGVIKGLDPALFNFKKEDLAETELAVPCYLIVDPKGTLMWDVGAFPDTAFKDDGAAVTQGYFYSTRTLKSQLAELGYAPSDITYLGLSHYHGDHVANSNEFAGSTWLVRPVERDAPPATSGEELEGHRRALQVGRRVAGRAAHPAPSGRRTCRSRRPRWSGRI